MCEAVLTQLAVRLVVGVARAHHVSPQYVALAVPGLCHTHNPCRSIRDDCAYCVRRGNCHADMAHDTTAVDAAAAPVDAAAVAAADGGLPKDLLADYLVVMHAILKKYGNDVLDAVRDAKHVDVEDVRRRLGLSHASGAQPLGNATCASEPVTNT